MNIAHIVCRFPPYVGGMGLVAYEQVKRLAQEGHQVTVFTLNSKDKLKPKEIDFKVRYMKSLRIGNAGIAPQLIWQLRKFDVIELHYPFYGAQEFIWLGKILGLYKKTKLIIWYHMDATSDNILYKIAQWKSWFVQKHLFKLADKICAASLDYVKNSKIKDIFNQHQDKFVEIPFGSNQHPETVKPSEVEALKRKLKINPDNQVVLFVGGLDSAHYFKGVPILIDAIKKLDNPKVRLVIVGDGNLRDDYQKQVAGLNLQNQVTFTGRIKFHQLKDYYSLSYITVLPSTTKAEAFGLVLIEAKTFGKPVIASDLPGVRDAVGQSGLTAKPGDANDLADKISRLLKDQSLYQKFSQQAVQDVKEKYDWDRHIQKLMATYKL